MHKSSEFLRSLSSKIVKESQSGPQPFTEFSCRKVCISGGKGVGKTSIALKAAIELSTSGYKVLLVDCDVENSILRNRLGINSENKFSKILTGELTFHECLIKRHNVDLLIATNDLSNGINSKISLNEIIIDIVSSHENEYDFIFIDLSSGFSKNNLALNAFCDHRWIIATPEKSSITDSYSLIKLLSQEFNIFKNHLLINMYQNEKQFQKLAYTLTETVGNFIGAETFVLGGIGRLDIRPDEVDNFFLSESKNEFQKNFVKLLYGFTEEVGEPLKSHSKSASQVAFEQDVQ